LPKSRKRKVRRGGPVSRSTYSPKKKSKTATIIAIAIIAGLALAAGIFLFTGGSNQAVGTEVTTSSGLKYVDEVIGTGPSPKPGQSVTVHYTGKLENGTVFDTSVPRNSPYTFAIGRGSVIKGWDEGIMTMKVGGRRRLIIPPQLGYGAAGRPPMIPGNATLYFDVELLDAK
jgi:peptidylprolyl isomerase